MSCTAESYTLPLPTQANTPHRHIHPAQHGQRARRADNNHTHTGTTLGTHILTFATRLASLDLGAEDTVASVFDRVAERAVHQPEDLAFDHPV